MILGRLLFGVQRQNNIVFLTHNLISIVKIPWITYIQSNYRGLQFEHFQKKKEDISIFIELALKFLKTQSGGMCQSYVLFFKIKIF